MNGIPKYNFYRKKYGDELLIDVINLESIKGKIRKTPVHRVTYYDITFIISIRLSRWLTTVILLSAMFRIMPTAFLFQPITSTGS